MIPQLLITLSPEGGLVAELPGPSATRRQLPLDIRTAGAVIQRILQAQAAGRSDGRDPADLIGLDSAPTQAQVREWEPVLLALQAKQFPEGAGAAAVATVTAEELGL